MKALFVDLVACILKLAPVDGRPVHFAETTSLFNIFAKAVRSVALVSSHPCLLQPKRFV